MSLCGINYDLNVAHGAIEDCRRGPVEEARYAARRPIPPNSPAMTGEAGEPTGGHLPGANRIVGSVAQLFQREPVS
jgi:hypothetical protein